MLRMLAFVATAVGVSGCGGAADFDIRCYSAGVLALVAEPNNAAAQEVTAYYLGRMEAADPSGKYAWAGVVITEAGVDDRVKGLVYVSALTPDVGETAGDQYEGFGIPSTFVIDTQSDGFGLINPENIREGFAADVSDADAAFMRDSQVPIAMSVFATPVTQTAWRTRPSWFIVATEDAAISPPMLNGQAEKIGATKVEIRASHVPMISQPRAVSDVIDQAARAVYAG